ncbi:hypothetical protein Emag_003720 [Eimeria magna]
MSDAEVSDGEREVQDISNPQVAEKCRVAAEIANAALKLVLSRAVPGADVLALCLLGDAFITHECKKVYQKKDKSKRKVDKGIAVPTSVSVNEVFANFSPSERIASRRLRGGDLVKVDLGVHVDGFVAAAAYTVICCSSNGAAFEAAAGTPAAAAAAEAVAAADAALSAYPPLSEQQQQQQQQQEEQQEGEDGASNKTLDSVEGPAAAVLKAAWVAVEAALRKLEVGAKASAVTKSIEQVAAEFGVKPMQASGGEEIHLEESTGPRLYEPSGKQLAPSPFNNSSSSSSNSSSSSSNSMKSSSIRRGA